MIKYLHIAFLFLLNGFILNYCYSQKNTEVIIQKGHQFPISKVEFSSDDKFLMSIDEGNQIIFWNVILGKQVGSYIEDSKIISAKFFPHSNQILWVNENNELKKWSIKDAKIIEIKKWDKKINDFCFLSDEEILLAENVIMYYHLENNETKIWNSNKMIGLKSDCDNKFVFGIHEDKLEVFLFDFQSNIIIENVFVYNTIKDKIISKKSFEFSSIDYNFEKKYMFYPYLNTIFGLDLVKNKSIIQKFTDYFDVNCTSVAYSDINNTLIYGTSDDKIFVHFLNEGRTKVFDIHLSQITHIKFNHKQDLFATSSKDHSIIIWDLKNLKPIHRLRMSSLPLTTIETNHMGNTLVVGNSLGEVKYINLYNQGGQPIMKNFFVHSNYVSDVFFKDSIIYSVGYDNKVVISNLKNEEIYTINFAKNKKAKKFKKNKRKLNEYSFKKINQIEYINQSNDLLISGQKNGKEKRFVLNLNDTLLKLIPSNERHTSYQISNFKTSEEIENYAFNSTNESFIYSNQNNIYYFNKEKDYFVGSHDYNITDLLFIPNSQKIATVGLDGLIKVWEYSISDTFKSNLVCTIVPIDRDKILIYTPENYYFSINEAIHEIGFKINEEYFLVEQFDLKFNRPDIVIESLGFADTNLIKAYHNAYLKRIKKMGFTEEMLNSEIQIPEIEILNANQIPIITEQDFLEINIKAFDSKYPLDRLNIWINDVAIFGTKGFDLKHLNQFTFEDKIKINLINGYNRIKCNILNQAGVESYTKTIEIQSNKNESKPNLYIISVGVSEYKENKYNLKYASKDAEDIVKLFSDKSKYYNEVFAKKLLNEEVTIKNIESIKEFLNNAKINDQVIVFFAGHGVLDENFDYYYASYDMDFNNPSKYGIPYEMIENILDGIKPIKKLLFMDTCHSGEVDKDEIELKNDENENKEKDIVFRNVGEAYQNKNSFLGIKNSSELSKELFTDLRKGTGATVISSSGGVEFSIESEFWNNGLFTYCLLYGLSSQKADKNKDGEITVSEIQEYVQTQVQILSKGKQTPTSRIVNQSLDYRVW